MWPPAFQDFWRGTTHISVGRDLKEEQEHEGTGMDRLMRTAASVVGWFLVLGFGLVAVSSLVRALGSSADLFRMSDEHARLLDALEQLLAEPSSVRLLEEFSYRTPPQSVAS